MKDKTYLFSYLIDVLVSLNVHKAFAKLGKEEEAELDKIKEKTLELINDFNTLNDFNPNINSSLFVKLIIKEKEDFIIKNTKKVDSFITFIPDLNLSIEESIKERLIKFGLEAKTINLVDAINRTNLIVNNLINEKLNNSHVIYLIYYVELEKRDIKLNGKFYIEKRNYQELNLSDLDKYILEKGEKQYVNTHC